jgi:hypothetical protein
VLSDVVLGLFSRSSLILLPSRNPKLSQDVGIFLELAIDVLLSRLIANMMFFLPFHGGTQRLMYHRNARLIKKKRI